MNINSIKSWPRDPFLVFRHNRLGASAWIDAFQIATWAEMYTIEHISGIR